MLSDWLSATRFFIPRESEDEDKEEDKASLAIRLANDTMHLYLQHSGAARDFRVAARVNDLLIDALDSNC